MSDIDVIIRIKNRLSQNRISILALELEVKVFTSTIDTQHDIWSNKSTKFLCSMRELLFSLVLIQAKVGANNTEIAQGHNEVERYTLFHGSGI